MPLSAHIEPAGGRALEGLVESAKLLVDGILALIEDRQGNSAAHNLAYDQLRLAAECLSTAARTMADAAIPSISAEEDRVSPTIKWQAEAPVGEEPVTTGLTMIG